MTMSSKQTTDIPIILPEPVNFAELCKELRQALSMSQAQMSNFLGVGLRHYQYWESGRYEPGGQYAIKLLAIRDQLAKTAEPVRDAVKGDLE